MGVEDPVGLVFAYFERPVVAIEGGAGNSHPPTTTFSVRAPPDASVRAPTDAVLRKILPPTQSRADRGIFGPKAVRNFVNSVRNHAKTVRNSGKTVRKIMHVRRNRNSKQKMAGITQGILFTFFQE